MKVIPIRHDHRVFDSFKKETIALLENLKPSQVQSVIFYANPKPPDYPVISAYGFDWEDIGRLDHVKNFLIDQILQHEEITDENPVDPSN